MIGTNAIIPAVAVDTSVADTTTNDFSWTASMLLSGLSFMDTSFRMNEWDGLVVAAFSLVFNLFLFHVVGQKYKVNWYSFVHACIVAPCAVACTYLDLFYSVELSSGGIPYPLRIILCSSSDNSESGGLVALTSLHRILPFFTLGYAVSDIVEGVILGVPDFLLHGVLLGITMSTVCYLEIQHTIISMLVMELSSIPLNFREATFLSPNGQVACMTLFALSFFLVRILFVPYVWAEFLVAFYQHIEEACFPDKFIYVVFVLGVLFHGLNLFWMLKIIYRMKRKFSGKEKMNEGALVKDLKNE